MRIVDIISKKRQGYALKDDEITFLLQSYLEKKCPDYQMSAFLMAVVFQGMNDGELYTFTTTMRDSGKTIRVPHTSKFIIDKHSTGGVGDKTSIALAPLMASLNVGIAKLTGRGLGHTGGTIDKFESIPGFAFPDHAQDMATMIDKTGIGLMGYSNEIVPLDKQLYTLRDVTSTVQSIPLIASSIMSKKLALESDAILLDVKTGNGSFMKKLEDAQALAQTMHRIGTRAKRNTACILTNMDQPLGTTVGNSLEVIEAIETLKGKGAQDFTELILTLAGVSLMLKKDVKSIEEGKTIAKQLLGTDAPLHHLAQFIEFCGGDTDVLHDYTKLPQTRHTVDIHAEKSGYIASFRTSDIGIAAMIIGAGRATKEDVIDPAVGITILCKQGQKVTQGDVLATIHYNDAQNLAHCKSLLREAICIDREQPVVTPLILDIIY